MFTMPPVQAEKQIKKPSAIQNPLSPVRTLGMVRVKGLEPSRLLTLEPKSSASANSAIPA